MSTAAQATHLREQSLLIAAPRFPPLLEILVKALDKNMTLEWLLIDILMEAMESAFNSLAKTRTLQEWAQELAPDLPLRDITSPEYPSLEARALRIQHPALPPDRVYFLIIGKSGCSITFLETKAGRVETPYLFRYWHIANLNVGSLFPPEIVRLVYETLSSASISTRDEVIREVDFALATFGRELRKLYTARGMKW